MIYHYYFKRLNLFKIPYKVLINYQASMGNSVKLWYNPYMMSHLLYIRNELYILNIAYTIIQIRKALNAIYHTTKFRGSLNIYANPNQTLPMVNYTINLFIHSWIPGIISNFKRVVGAIQAHKKYIEHTRYFGTRRQYRSISINKINTKRIEHKLSKKRSIKKRMRKRFKIPKVPSISLSLVDDRLWANECHCFSIPTIQICDTQSNITNIDYPIICNQRSPVFIPLFTHLTAEVYGKSILDSRLAFLSWNKYSRNVPRIRKRKKRVNTKIYHTDVIFGEPNEAMFSRYRKFFDRYIFSPLFGLNTRTNRKRSIIIPKISQLFIKMRKIRNYLDMLRLGYNQYSPGRRYRLLQYDSIIFQLFTLFILFHGGIGKESGNPISYKYKRQFMEKQYLFCIMNEKKKPLNINKKTYFFNKRSFTYEVKDFINSSLEKGHYEKIKQYHKMILHYLWLSVAYIKRVYDVLSYLRTFIITKYNGSSRFMRRARYEKFYKNYGDLFRTICKYYKFVIVFHMGLKKALRSKKRQKKWFLAEIPFNKRNLSSRILYAFLITPSLTDNLLLLKNIRKRLNKMKLIKKSLKVRSLFLNKNKYDMSNPAILQRLNMMKMKTIATEDKYPWKDPQKEQVDAKALYLSRLQDAKVFLALGLKKMLENSKKLKR